MVKRYANALPIVTNMGSRYESQYMTELHHLALRHIVRYSANLSSQLLIFHVRDDGIYETADVACSHALTTTAAAAGDGTARRQVSADSCMEDAIEIYGVRAPKPSLNTVRLLSSKQ